jgi:plastocyanin
VRSKPISGGGASSVKIKYDSPGTYYFVCTFHAGQGGTLLVQ